MGDAQERKDAEMDAMVRAEADRFFQTSYGVSMAEFLKPDVTAEDIARLAQRSPVDSEEEDDEERSRKASDYDKHGCECTPTPSPRHRRA